ncbi:MAG TPA: site-2 protease family protein, partial [Actinomycetota bacterium]|nr:site-2 protease family protein [Actinomycetota bacterium]
MEENIRLGRIAGIRIGANWSLLAIFVLLVVGLAGGAFPSEYPGRSAAAYLAAAVVAALLFFVSLLAHELAHALVARRDGLEVEGITFWLFGGVSRLSGEARTPGSDFRIAAVGPLTSLLLAAVFALAASGLDALGTAALAVAVARWLARI